MSEKLIDTVVTKDDFKIAFKKLGLQPTDVCMVHTAMSKFQYLVGGPEAIVNALEETLSRGTLMISFKLFAMLCRPMIRKLLRLLA